MGEKPATDDYMTGAITLTVGITLAWVFICLLGKMDIGVPLLGMAFGGALGAIAWPKFRKYTKDRSGHAGDNS